MVIFHSYVAVYQRVSWEYMVLDGGFKPTPLKNDGVKVSWDDDIPNTWNNKKCSKPPSRVRMEIFYEVLMRC